MWSPDVVTWCEQILGTYKGSTDVEIDIRNSARIMYSLKEDRDRAREAADIYRGKPLPWIDHKIDIEKGGTF